MPKRQETSEKGLSFFPLFERFKIISDNRFVLFFLPLMNERKKGDKKMNHKNTKETPNGVLASGLDSFRRRVRKDVSRREYQNRAETKNFHGVEKILHFKIPPSW